MGNLKIGVEVINARNLIAKDGQGSSNAFVELQLDNQRFHTTIKHKDLNPVWNETFYFNVSDPENIPSLVLDVYVYNNNKDSFLGKVRINGTCIVPYPNSIVQHYPLEKRGVFSHVKGEIGLKVFQIDDPSIKASVPLPAIESVVATTSTTAASSVRSTAASVQDTTRQLYNYITTTFTSNKKEPTKESKHTFHHLPNKKIDSQSQPQSQSQSQPQTQPQMQSYPHVSMFSGPSSYQFPDYGLKETSPILGGGQVVGGRVIRSDKPTSTYDLVEPMHFLYVRVVKAHGLPDKDVTGGVDPYVEVRIGNYKGTTRHYEKKTEPEWNEVFAFSKENLQSSVLEVRLKDKDIVKDDFVGILRFDLNEVPTRVPPDSPLAPEWYRLQNKKGEKKQGELMMAVWMGTQADEAFPNAIHSDAVGSSFENSSALAQIRSKVYVSPRLWYVRVNVIEAQDLVAHEKSRFPNVHVKARIGNQVLKTRHVQTSTMNAIWNEDLMFVAAEPFDDNLILSVEDLIGSNKDEVLGKVILPLNMVDRRLDDRMVPTRWYNLSYESEFEPEKNKFSSRLHLRVSLDGGYHVLDESTQYSSDLRPTAKQLWKPSVGVLELGILKIDGLHPMKKKGDRGTSDTYCVAKYGHKWVRTRSIIDSLNPKYNEQYTWEVFDTATVLTVGVFDNSLICETNSQTGEKDKKIGKVRIRISTLETGRVYTHSYPLLVLHPSGVKKMGELHLAIRFSSTSVVNMMSIYSKPLLPKMHYVRPLNVAQLETLRFQAVAIVAARLGRAEPPLKKEVIEYMTDAHSHLWSMRKSKANFFRLISVFNGLFAVAKWFGEVRMWKNPITTSLVHVLYVMLVCFPELIFPTIFLYMFMIGIWNYRYRPKYPPHMDTRISYADMVLPDDMDEEFDTFPTSKNAELVRFRYDRLRSIAGRIQTVVGDIASQGERVQALLSWRDPRATVMFIAFCLAAAIVFYVTPFQLLAAFAGFYVMRHPKFRQKLPSAPLNFFRRLPARTDSML